MGVAVKQAVQKYETFVKRKEKKRQFQVSIILVVIVVIKVLINSVVRSVKM